MESEREREMEKRVQEVGRERKRDRRRVREIGRERWRKRDNMIEWEEDKETNRWPLRYWGYCGKRKASSYPPPSCFLPTKPLWERGSSTHYNTGRGNLSCLAVGGPHSGTGNRWGYTQTWIIMSLTIHAFSHIHTRRQRCGRLVHTQYGTADHTTRFPLNKYNLIFSRYKVLFFLPPQLLWTCPTLHKLSPIIPNQYER